MVMKKLGRKKIPHNVLKKVPKGWKKSRGVTTNPIGYERWDNGKSRFSGKRKSALIKIKTK